MRVAQIFTRLFPMPKPSMRQEDLSAFKRLTGQVQALTNASSLTYWDQVTTMPKQGQAGRSWQMGVLAGFTHEILVSDTMGTLLTTLREKSAFKTLDENDKALVRKVGRDYDREKKIPASLVEELASVAAEAHPIWAKAKEQNRFQDFAPILEKLVSLNQRLAKCIGFNDSPYDALLDLYEPGLTTKELDKLFETLKKELVPLIQKIKTKSTQPDRSFLYRQTSFEKQLSISRFFLERLGLDLSDSSSTARLDRAPHPFCTHIGQNDVRITTRPEDNFFLSVATALHEGGHGIYEAGINQELARTPLYTGTSLGIHESQSRLFETIVGQGRPFWESFYPTLQEFFPKELKEVSLNDFLRAINVVEPSLIRVEADEVTYQLHIMLRYEIEKALIEGTLAVKDLPHIWNQKMEEYLGVVPTSDSKGVLQDMHWSEGAFGYFPSYTLGNLYAAQLYNKIKEDIPEIEAEIRKGNLQPLISWLKEKVHKFGAGKYPDEIIRDATGEPLNAQYFINYVKGKYKELYTL